MKSESESDQFQERKLNVCQGFDYVGEDWCLECNFHSLILSTHVSQQSSVALLTVDERKTKEPELYLSSDVVDLRSKRSSSHAAQQRLSARGLSSSVSRASVRTDNAVAHNSDLSQQRKAGGAESREGEAGRECGHETQTPAARARNGQGDV